MDAILTAATRMLPEQGMARSTTNRIAKLAGVSIGSLYQYFPDKDAIFAELVDRELKRNEDAILAVARSEQTAPLGDLVEAVVDVSVDRLLEQADLLRELLSHAFRLKKVGAVVSSRESADAQLAAILAAHPEVARDDPTAAARVCSSALIGVVQHVILAQQDVRETAALKVELKRLLEAYLRAPS